MVCTPGPRAGAGHAAVRPVIATDLTACVARVQLWTTAARWAQLASGRRAHCRCFDATSNSRSFIHPRARGLATTGCRPRRHCNGAASNCRGLIDYTARGLATTGAVPQPLARWHAFWRVLVHGRVENSSEEPCRRFRGPRNRQRWQFCWRGGRWGGQPHGNKGGLCFATAAEQEPSAACVATACTCGDADARSLHRPRSVHGAPGLEMRRSM
mmetsp:Transcript_55634/g.155049  ORF Transcript_55634/g.155049 Transcript_55634/m.155049 type:complete len:213 (+) Transcript_55634:147-785(+)